MTEFALIVVTCTGLLSVVWCACLEIRWRSAREEMNLTAMRVLHEYFNDDERSVVALSEQWRKARTEQK